MLEIDHIKNNHNYDCFNVITDDGVIYISFEGNMDLYWTYIHEGSILDHPDTKTLYITKENYDVYCFFDNLYNRIINCNPFDGYLDIYQDKSLVWPLNENNPEKLLDNGIVSWHSDDFVYDNASCFSIEKLEDEYKITFKKSKYSYDDGHFMTFSVRISNSGSRYNPFNCAFMQMYQELKTYDPNYHQIHFEELLYKPKNRVLKPEE